MVWRKKLAENRYYFSSLENQPFSTDIQDMDILVLNIFLCWTLIQLTYYFLYIQKKNNMAHFLYYISKITWFFSISTKTTIFSQF